MSPTKRFSLKFSELARRITGISTPGFGLQWIPPKSEREAVRAFLTFLEDRRVLYRPENLEVAGEVERSVQEIRKRCTENISELPEQSPAASAIRMIRGACRHFLDHPRANFRNLYQRDYGGSLIDAGFFSALGELRAKIGLQIAVLATRYEVELESELEKITPFLDWEDEM